MTRTDPGATREPTPFELWQQAKGDGARYRELMREHGFLIPLTPGEKQEPLPCGWPGKRDPGTSRGTSTYPDQRGPCTCGPLHSEIGHELKPDKTRGKCSVTDTNGECGCRAYDEAAGAVYVGRPSIWGNPYRVVGRNIVVDQWGREYWCAEGEAAGVAVRKFREDVFTGRPPYDELDPKELRGKDLVCWCPLFEPCHATVLLKLANAVTT